MMSRFVKTLPPHPPPTLSLSSNHVFFLAGRWSTSGWGVTHISLPTQEYDRGRQEKTNRRTNEQTWGYQEQKRGIATLYACADYASVGYQRKFHNATGIRHLETLLHWTLSCLLASLLGVWCWLPLRGSTPTASAPVQLPTTLSSVASSTLVRVPLPLPDTARFFLSKNPLSGFAPKQTRLLWRPTPIVLQIAI